MTRARDYWREAGERWPALQQFLAGYLHQDWPDEHGDPEAAIDLAIRKTSLTARMQVCRDWCDWNGEIGSRHDPGRALTEGLGVEMSFDDGADARQFMNGVYERLIVSIRREAGREWKP